MPFLQNNVPFADVAFEKHPAYNKNVMYFSNHVEKVIQKNINELMAKEKTPFLLYVKLKFLQKIFPFTHFRYILIATKTIMQAKNDCTKYWGKVKSPFLL